MLLYKNAYYQGSMSDDNAACILSILEQEEMPVLSHCIFDLTDEQIAKLIEIYETWELEHGTCDNIEDPFPYDSLKTGKLRPEQTIGVAFMFYAGSALLGDEVGLGKTVETAGLCNLVRSVKEKENKPFSFCFLTEQTSAEQIRAKMIRFTGHYVGLLPNGERGVVEDFISANPNGANAYSIVGTHALLNSDEFILYAARHPFDVFIIDESAILKNKRNKGKVNQTYANAKAILSKQERKILLNATPLENAVREFYNQLVLLDSTYMPTVAQFEADYCRKERVGHTYQVVGTKNEALFRQAVKLRYLARTRKNLGAKYEDNTCTTYVVEMNHIQHELMRRSSLYQMICDYPPDVDLTIEPTIENIPKIKVVLALLQKIRERDPKEKAYIYCHFVNCQTTMAKILNERGFRSVILNGRTKVKERARILHEFENEDKYDVIITNVKRGLDLNTVLNCIMYTIDPNPQKMVQVEGRMTRDFDICGKHLYMIVMKGREEGVLNTKLKDRVAMTENLAVTGNSMVMDAIRGQFSKQYITDVADIKIE